ncbi:MAG TPA: class I SAM-dependent methyltransferase [Candidatus Binatia bacterium]|nr:class I SAM-dependent methyltransferase [Candidatus Binatia bacterium]
MRDDLIRWEQRYRDRAAQVEEPASQFLQQCLPLIPRGRILDVAAGDGRNAVHLARHGRAVEAIDISFTGLCRLRALAARERLHVDAIQADLDDYPLPRSRYAGIVNIRFLQRGLFASLKAALQPRGVILVETFLIDQRSLGHPTNPRHLLNHGELRDLLQGLTILFADEGRFDTESGPAFLARAAARRDRD